MAYWLVTDAPPKFSVGVGTPDVALTPDDSGLPNLPNRLLAMSGWTIGEFLAVFTVRRTVWKRPWPLWIDEGRQRAVAIAEEARGAAGVVVVGHMAAAAFGLAGEDLFEWFGKYALLPSPCPTRLSRYWNTPGMREKAQGFFSEILAKHRARRAHPGAATKRRPCGPR